MTPLSDRPLALPDRLSTATQGIFLVVGASMFVSVLTQVWLARRFGPVGLGEYNATTLFVTTIATLSILGLPYTIIERVSALQERQDPTERSFADGAVAIGLLFGMAGALVALVTWETLASLLRLSAPASPALVATATLLAAGQFSAMAVHVARLRMVVATAVALAQPVTVGVGVAASYVDPGLTGSALAVAGFLATGTTALVSLFTEGFRPRLTDSALRLVRHRTLPSAAVLYLTVMAAWIDRMVVGIITGPAGLGLFAAVSFFSEAALRVPRAVGVVGVGAYARLAEDRVGVSRVLDSQVRLVSLFFVVAAAGLIAGGADLLGAMFGPGFAEAQTALRLLAVALTPMGLTLTLATNAMGTGRFRRLSIALLALGPFQLVMGILATNILSITGMALAQLVLWCTAGAIFLVWRPGHRPVLRPGTLLFVVISTIGAAVIGFTISLSGTWWPVRVAAAALLTLAASGVLLVRSPEIRILRRLMSARFIPGAPPVAISRSEPR